MRSPLFRSVFVIVPVAFSLVVGCDGGGGGGGGGDGVGGVDPDDVVVTTTPSDDAPNVPLDATISITFAEEADTESIGGEIDPETDFELSWSADGRTLTVIPTEDLQPGTEYTVTITELWFTDGSALSEPFSFSFETTGGGDANENDNGSDDGNENDNGNENENENVNENGNDNSSGDTRVWEQAGSGAAGNFIGVQFDKNDAGVAYACSDVAGVMRSTDGGRTWSVRSAGLGNYEVASFAVDPFDSNTLYAGVGAFAVSDKAGIYVSHDAGLSWEHLPSTFNNGITFRRFRTANAIAPDPSEQGVILSGSRANGIWRSGNGGANWTQVYAPPATSATIPSVEGSYLVPDDTDPPFVPPVSDVVFDPSDSDIVYAGLLGGGVVKSTDGGLTWERTGSGLSDSAIIEGLGVGSNDVLYAAAGFEGVFKSTNGGTTWQAVNGDVPLTDSAGMGWRTSVAVHPSNPDIAYMSLATDDAFPVWSTADGGASWVEVEGTSVSYDEASDPTRVWSAGSAPVWQVKIDPFDSNSLLAVSFWTIQRSDDAGLTWADSVAGAQNTCVTSIYLDTDHGVGEPDTLYATHMDAGLLASTDGGATWSAVLPSGSDADSVFAGHAWRFAVARVGDTKYYYMTADPWPPVETSQVLRSTDGVNFTAVFETPRHDGDFMGGMLGLAVDPTNPSTIYASQDGGSVFKSTDNGNNWSETAGQPDNNSFTYALAVDDNGTVFAGTLLDGLWRSTDGGASWQRTLAGLGTVFHCLAAAGAVYASAGDDANLYRSTDGGSTWEALTSFTSVDDGDGVGDAGWAIAVDPDDPDHILFSRQEGWHPADDGPGVVESFDGGQSWHALNDGLGLPKVSGFAFGSDGTVYAGTSCAGVWRLP